MSVEECKGMDIGVPSRFVYAQHWNINLKKYYAENGALHLPKHERGTVEVFPQHQR
jgi:hypothetical protein